MVRDGSRDAATIQDVARLSMSSRSTVSRFLGDPDSVSEDARRRISEAIRELDYVPNLTARALRAGRSTTVTMLVGDLTQPLIGHLAQQLGRVARTRDCRLSLMEHSRRPELIPSIIDRLDTSNSCALIIATATDLDTLRVRTALTRLVQRGVRAVSAIQYIPGTGIGAITQDYYGIAYHATTRALVRSTKGVALAVPHVEGPYSRPLVRGYRDALRDATRALGERLVTMEYSGRGFEAAQVKELVRDGYATLLLPGTLQALSARRALEESGLLGELSPMSLESTPLLDLVAPDLERYSINSERFVTALLDAVLDVSGSTGHRFIGFRDPEAEDHSPL